MPRSGETIGDRQERFLLVFRETVNVKEALAAAGIHPSTLSRWITGDMEGFTAKYDEADKVRLKNLEERMFDVLNWASDPERYDKILRYPNLLMFALKGAFPERYGDKGTIGQDEARRLFDELMKMKDDPKQDVGSGEKSIDDQLNDILG